MLRTMACAASPPRAGGGTSIKETAHLAHRRAASAHRGWSGTGPLVSSSIVPRDKTISRQPEILLQLARDAGPLHLQIERGVREAIRSGRLRRGATLPSSRSLAHDLGVSRGVVVEAYAQLLAEGFLVGRGGSGTFVAAEMAPVSDEPPAPRPASVRYDFRPGLPDLALFPRIAFARATRQVLRSLSPADLDYAVPQGSHVLRAALAEYVGRVRQVVATPSTLVVCTGFAQALGIVARTLARRGARRFAIEDPCHPGQRKIVREAGLQPVSVPVDEGGLRVDRLSRQDVDAVLVTPAHHFPTGVVLAPERRQELCAWAGRRGAIIMEDDYDAEYRYDRAATGALQGLDPEHVIYAGSASKILTPALRLGWMVVPREWRDAITETKWIADLGSPTIDQLIYARFLRSGELDRHLRRMRLTYRRRRDVLLATLARHLPGWQVRGLAAGLHVVVEPPHGMDEAQIVGAAARHSVRVYPMSDYRARPSNDAPPALVLGYGGLNEAQLREAVRRLAEAVRN